MTSSYKRCGWIDALRGFAACAIVFIHIVGGWTSSVSIESLGGPRRFFDCVLIQVLVRWAVPCFVMISGYLLLDDKKEISLQKTGKYIARMAAVLLTFGLLYCLMETAASDGFGDIPHVVAVSVKNLLEGRSWTHMWYVYMMLGMYLMLPLFRAFTKNVDDRTYRFMLAILFGLTIVRPAVNRLFGIAIEIMIPINTVYPFYFLMGYYIRKHKMKRSRSMLWLAAGTIGMLIGQAFGADNSPDNLLVAVYSVAIFALAADSSFLEKCSKNRIISQISKYSFGIYIIHPFFLNVLNKVLHIYPDIFPVVIGEAVFFAVAVVCAYLSVWILCKIKVMRKILL